ncbi:MAG TPA: UDP-N-acetylmuramyl-tripeptide synthetase [Candidatus Paceibacterota bacterium]|nr:UDP-N-acetylmuramyl-tripeptide synthetase [Candidatus Paceibacterota bacterium]
MLRNLYHYLFAFLANLIYGAPSRKIFVLGLTGTKGKSTALEMLDSVLSVAGRRTALLTSTRRKIGDRSEKSPYTNTMPGRGAIQAFLKEAVRAGCDIALVEVTSEGMKQHRGRFIDWDAAVFLNLHPEHIEAHGSFEKYREAKLDLFRELGRSEKPRKFFVVNASSADAPHFQKVAGGIPGGETFLATLAEVDRIVRRIRKDKNPDWLLADFNIENIAVVAKTARALGVGEEDIITGLEKFPGLRGRMDFVQHEPFSVVVDYAHTPESLRAVYNTLRKHLKEGSRLICVLGSAGGGRDKWKRPELGKIAGESCDILILTSEDPYDEDPEEIIRAIEKGIPADKAGKILKITNRRTALREAVAVARNGDVVVSTGMGSQDWFYGPRGAKIPWDEHRIFEEILKSGG